MSRRTCRCGFTLVELVVLLVILGIVLALLLPAIHAARGTARRAGCTNNLRQVVLAVANFESSMRRLPPSSGVTRDAEGKITAVDGWSFYVPLLPFLEEMPLNDTLDVKNGRPLAEPDSARGTPHATALATPLRVLLCPDVRVQPFVDPQTKKEAITSYKAMGATHTESLSVASANPQKPKYEIKRAGGHPDGVCFPGRPLKMGDIRDGTSNTVIFVETVEPRFARWTVGAEVTLVGLPSNVEYEIPAGMKFYAPKGFDIDSAERGKTKIDATYQTYLNWDFEKKPYDGADGSKGGKYGPSSRHPGVVNHAFLDGSVQGISKDVDAALYMFVITRDGADPANLFWEQQGR